MGTLQFEMTNREKDLGVFSYYHTRPLRRALPPHQVMHLWKKQMQSWDSLEKAELEKSSCSCTGHNWNSTWIAENNSGHPCLRKMNSHGNSTDKTFTTITAIEILSYKKRLKEHGVFFPSKKCERRYSLDTGTSGGKHQRGREEPFKLKDNAGQILINWPWVYLGWKWDRFYPSTSRFQNILPIGIVRAKTLSTFRMDLDTLMKGLVWTQWPRRSLPVLFLWSQIVIPSNTSQGFDIMGPLSTLHPLEPTWVPLNHIYIWWLEITCVERTQSLPTQAL